MTVWSAFLELFQVGLFGLTHFYGGHLGAAVVTFSLLARIALLPLSVRVALGARKHARRLRALQPRLLRVRERWAEDPERQALETMEVHRKAGVGPVHPGTLKGTLLQTPVFVGLYHAVRGALAGASGRQGWLWVANLARPDPGIALFAAVLAGAGVLAGATEPRPAWTLAVPAVAVGAMALATSAGFGLYLAASGAVGTLQGLLVRRIEAAAAAGVEGGATTA